MVYSNGYLEWVDASNQTNRWHHWDFSRNYGPEYAVGFDEGDFVAWVEKVSDNEWFASAGSDEHVLPTRDEAIRWADEAARGNPVYASVKTASIPSWADFSPVYDDGSGALLEAPAGDGNTWNILYQKETGNKVDISFFLADSNGDELYEEWVVSYDPGDLYYFDDYREEAIRDAWEDYGYQVVQMIKDSSVKTARNVEWDLTYSDEEEVIWDIEGSFVIGGVSLEESPEGYYWWTDDGVWKDGYANTYEGAKSAAIASVEGLTVTSSKTALVDFSEVIDGETVDFVGQSPESPAYAYPDGGEWVVEDLDAGEAMRVRSRGEAVQALEYHRDHGILPGYEIF